MPEAQKALTRPGWPLILAGALLAGAVMGTVCVWVFTRDAGHNFGAPAQAQVSPPCPTCDGTGIIVTQFDNKGIMLWQGSPLVFQRLTVDFQEAVITGEPPPNYDFPKWIYEAARNGTMPQYTDCPACND